LTAFYQNLAEKAIGLLDRFGSSLQFSRTVIGAYSPYTGQPATSNLTFSLLGVVSNYNSFEIDNTKVEAGDLKIIVQAGGNEAPEINDEVDFNGVSYLIVDVNPLSPAGVPVVYTCQARAGVGNVFQ